MNRKVYWMVIHLCFSFIPIDLFVAGLENVECHAHTCNKCGKRIQPWYFTVILCLPMLEWNSLQCLSVFSVTVQLLEEFYPMCYYMQLVRGSWKIILSAIIKSTVGTSNYCRWLKLPCSCACPVPNCLKISRTYQDSFCCFFCW